MEYTVCTKLNVNNVEVSWDILNFSLNGKDVGDYLISPNFKLGPNVNAMWHLRLYPKGYNNQCNGFVSLYFVHDMKYPMIEVEFLFAILDSKGNEANKYTGARIINDNIGRGVGKFISMSDIKEYLISDTLTIVCKIRVGVNKVKIPVLSESTRVSTDELSQDFQILFENQKFTDVILAVKGKTFNAHKAILSTRSSVFSALFEHEMQENINNIVDIEDAEPNVVEEMLRYIYTGKVKDVNRIACELLRVADKYFLEGLKLICENTLCKNLSVENVLEMLFLADLHNAKTLRTKAVEFSVAHAKEVIQTPAFKSAENLNPQTVLELFQKLASNQST